MILDPLPLDGHLATIQAHVRQHRAVVITAAPGSGKTTRVAPALLDAGPVILLQPRRVAARAVARRIADERGWTIGREVGWQIRFERRFDPDTRLLVVTEGILTARLQHDPLLSEFVTVVIDEFHERSVHADLGIALARQAWLARSDLRLVVMSATLEESRVAAFLGGCPVVQVPGSPHPTAIDYAAGQTVAQAVIDLWPETRGTILCFLPGAREIARTQAELVTSAGASGLDVVPLHGSLDGAAQDEALQPGSTRRVVLATNIAETSLTVPGVSTVIDSGLVKVARFDARRGVDSLTLERVTRDSATQRAGRAARQGPGRVRRLWDERDRLRPRIEPEIARVDLASAVLDVVAWGATPMAFEWFDVPPLDRVEAALRLLQRLGALEGDAASPRLTPIGRQLQRIPLHPRLARILLEGRGTRTVAAACALMSAPFALIPGISTTCDLLPLLDRFDLQPFHVRQVADHLERLASRLPETAPLPRRDSAPRPRAPQQTPQLERALFAGYGDRVAKRRTGSPDRFILASGHGAVLARASGVRDSELIVALEVMAGERDGAAESWITAASHVDRDWVTPTAQAVEHWLDAESGRVRAARIARYDAIVLTETPVAADPAEAARLLGEAWLAREPDARTERLLRRARFARLGLELRPLALRAAHLAASLDEIDIERHLDVDSRRTLERDAPSFLAVPSGRSMALDYAPEGSVSVSVKLQELFGLAESPLLGPGRVPVTFHLLAPNGRPVQTTRDLRSFWEHTYPEVRKELRGRYPKHPWPDDPWTARATHRTVGRPPKPAR